MTNPFSVKDTEEKALEVLMAELNKNFPIAAALLAGQKITIKVEISADPKVLG